MTTWAEKWNVTYHANTAQKTAHFTPGTSRATCAAPAAATGSGWKASARQFLSPKQESGE